MKRFLITFFAVYGVLTLTALVSADMHKSAGTAFIRGTTNDSSVNGVVTLTETEDGLKVTADIYNVPSAGEHGFHIHEFGSCEEAGKAAGGHYNPAGVDHGLLPKDGAEMAHAGDMGNITIGEDGHGTLDVVLPGVSLIHGEKTVAGRAIILHEKADDFGQPTGNAGGRIGCGAIILTKE